MGLNIGGVQKMEYKEYENSWRESLSRGDLDEALKNVQIEIATNLMNVHNKFCIAKLSNPADVFAYETYGKTCSDDAKEKMNAFVRLNYWFMEICHGLDVDSTCPKEEVFESFQQLEEKVKEEISKL